MHNFSYNYIWEEARNVELINPEQHSNINKLPKLFTQLKNN